MAEGVTSDQLVIGDPLDGRLEGQTAGWVQLDRLVGRWVRMLVSCLGLVALTSISSGREFSPKIMPS